MEGRRLTARANPFTGSRPCSNKQKRRTQGTSSLLVDDQGLEPKTNH